MSKEKKLSNFDPSGIGHVSDGLFGLPFNFEESEIILLPVPWEVTTSFGGGTSEAPLKILEASRQVDIFDPDYPDAWKRGYFMLDIPDELKARNKQYRLKAQEVIKLLERGADMSNMPELDTITAEVNKACKEMVNWTYSQSKILLDRGKKVGLIGGDHSTPLGFYKALGEIHKEFSILQIDAHADLRKAYEGFTYSHASIMYNAMEIPEIKSFIQLGIRDFCEEEFDVVKASGDRIRLMHWNDITSRIFDGSSWKTICSEIVEQLPSKIYISLDVDGLSPEFCPNTGTPVPGGLSFDQLSYLIRLLKSSGKEIIGFDICETGNGSYDANVSSRLLFQLCNSI